MTIRRQSCQMIKAMNKIMHGLIAVGFAFACWCLWGMLSLTSNLMLRVSDHPPAFTQLCVGLKPLFVVLPVAAASYCLYVWIRKTENPNPWVSFLATTTGILVLAALPTIIAIWLPVIQFIDLAGKK